MKTIHDPQRDTLTIELSDAPVAESEEQNPGTILDYDQQGNLVRIEILDASHRISEIRHMHFEIAA